MKSSYGYSIRIISGSLLYETVLHVLPDPGSALLSCPPQPGPLILCFEKIKGRRLDLYSVKFRNLAISYSIIV